MGRLGWEAGSIDLHMYANAVPAAWDCGRAEGCVDHGEGAVSLFEGEGGWVSGRCDDRRSRPYRAGYWNLELWEGSREGPGG